MKYYANFSYRTQPKNKAQEAALLKGKTKDATLISSDIALDEFIKSITDSIDAVNKNHPRCAVIDCRRHNWGSTGEIGLYVGEIFQYTFYPVKQEFSFDNPDDIKKPHESEFIADNPFWV